MRSLVQEMLDLLTQNAVPPSILERVLHHQISLEPTNRVPRERVLELYRERGEYEHLLHELEALWRLAPTVAHLSLIRERAQLLSDRGENVGLATEAWEEVLGLTSDDSEALLALQYLYRQQERDRRSGYIETKA